MSKRARANLYNATDTSRYTGVGGDPDLPAWVETVTSMPSLMGSVAGQMRASRSVTDTGVGPQTQPTQERLLTILEVAEQLAVSRKTVWRMIKRGELRVVRFSRRLMRVRLSELGAIIRRGGVAGKHACSRSGIIVNKCSIRSRCSD